MCLQMFIKSDPVYIQYSAKSAKDVANNKLKVNDKLIGITVRLE